MCGESINDGTDGMSISIEELRAVMTAMEFGGTVPLNNGAVVTVSFPLAAAYSRDAGEPCGCCPCEGGGIMTSAVEVGTPVLTIEPAQLELPSV